MNDSVLINLSDKAIIALAKAIKAAIDEAKQEEKK